MQQVRARLRAIPGVHGRHRRDAAAARRPADQPARWGTEAAVTDPSKFRQANFHVVLPGYFETMRTRLVAGRTFTDADNNIDQQTDLPRQIIIDEELGGAGVSRRAGGRQAAVPAHHHAGAAVVRGDRRGRAPAALVAGAARARGDLHRSTVISVTASPGGGRCGRPAIRIRSHRRCAPPWRRSIRARRSPKCSRCRRSSTGRWRRCGSRRR